MKEKPNQKDTAWSNQSRDADRPDFALSEDELERALQRLQRTVSAEAAPAIWTLSTAAAPADSGSAALANHAAAQGAAGASDHAAAQGLAGASAGPVAAVTTPALGSALAQSAGARGNRKSPSATRKRLPRIAAGLIAAALVGGVFISPLGTKAMAAAMQTLYFHNIVGVGQDDISLIENALSGNSDGGSRRIDLKKYGTVDVFRGQNPGQNLTLDEANQRAGLAIKPLPGFDAQHATAYYNPGEDLTFRLNVNAINGLIRRLGGTTAFPAAVDGQPILIHIPGQVSEDVSGTGTKFIHLNALKMPTVQVPSGVNLNQVRQALLDLPFLPSDIRQSLTQSNNWKDTVYVPTNGKVTNLTINGYSAVLQTDSHGMNPTIMWVENGVLYQLSGSPASFPSTAAIVAQAKELAQ